ncbi:MAG: ABC transporter [Novosphingobium sp.]|nr:ABC transporter [Novosphingobium sp.]
MIVQTSQSGRRIALALALVVLLALAAAVALAERSDEGGGAREHGLIGLFTSLPILWRETPDLADVLVSDAPPHWAQAAIADRGKLVAIDTLAPDGGPLPLDPDAILIIAQPRPLAPEENVALDDWVRGGGRLLLFADPLLTSHSAYALGDKRRPQDVVLLSPILARWGLALHFDEAQPAGEHEVELFGGTAPVNLPGSFTLSPGSAGCSIEAHGIAARCRIGAGRVIAVADAAMLKDAPANAVATRRTALERLLRHLASEN